MAAITATIKRELVPVAEVPVPLPRDCLDGLFSAYWARPHAYLDSDVRAQHLELSLADARYVADGLARLAADLESGEWERRYGRLLSLPELDLGHRLFVAERLGE
jgi:hypothetical protein